MPDPASPRGLSGLAGSPACEKTSGGFTEVAADLSKFIALPVTRQCVCQWWSRRGKNGFPAGREVPWRGKMTRHEFEFAEVRKWWDTTYRVRSRLVSVTESSTTTELGLHTHHVW